MDESRRFQGNLDVHAQSLKQSSPRTLAPSPSENLSFELYQTFSPDIPASKSLTSFSKTYFVTELPRRVGISPACDLAMKAVCLAHSSLLDWNDHNIVQSRIQYGRALVELRRCVADQKEARTTSTLCATMLLGIVEVCQHSPQVSAS